MTKSNIVRKIGVNVPRETFTAGGLKNRNA